jgi:hypothetical protein
VGPLRKCEYPNNFRSKSVKKATLPKTPSMPPKKSKKNTTPTPPTPGYIQHPKITIILPSLGNKLNDFFIYFFFSTDEIDGEIPPTPVKLGQKWLIFRLRASWRQRRSVTRFLYKDMRGNKKAHMMYSRFH